MQPSAVGFRAAGGWYCAGTIDQPFGSDGFRGNYGNAVGPVDAITEQFTPPDGFTNVVDVSAYILNVSDPTQIKFGFLGSPWANAWGNLQPGDCP